MRNDALVSATTLVGDRFPYEAGSFDACVSNFVVEHIDAPDHHLQEIRRVLKPGSPYVFRTPNVLHYVYSIARLTPHGFHQAVANRLRHLPSDAHEPYPTVYAMNSPRAIRRLAASAGFSVELLRLSEKNPSYGMASRALFFPFLAYERMVNATDLLAAFRATIFTVLRAAPASMTCD
jgi:SAM-dependent methyltransferase